MKITLLSLTFKSGVIDGAMRKDGLVIENRVKSHIQNEDYCKAFLVCELKQIGLKKGIVTSISGWLYGEEKVSKRDGLFKHI